MASRRLNEQAARVLWLLGLVSLIGVSGCASKGTVYGKVTYKGEPVPNASVGLWAAKATESNGATTTKEGAYEVGNLVPGTYKVTVTTTAPPKGGISQMPMPNVPGGTPMPGQEKYVEIPKKFADQSGTPLTITVTRGRQPLDINLDQ